MMRRLFVNLKSFLHETYNGVFLTDFQHQNENLLASQQRYLPSKRLEGPQSVTFLSHKRPWREGPLRVTVL